MTASLDGSAAVYAATGTSAVTGTLSCQNSGNVICVSAMVTGTTITGVTGGGVTFALRAAVGAPIIELWVGYSAGPFNDAVTVTFAGAGTVATVHAFGIADSLASSYFDKNSTLPNTGTTDPRTVSTSNKDTIIIGAFRFSATANPTSGATYTQILGSAGSGFMLTEYKVVTTPQSALSVTVGTGVGLATGAIADALIAPPHTMMRQPWTRPRPFAPGHAR